MRETMPAVTQEHLREACALARLAREEGRAVCVGREERRYDQSVWDCGTACCIHGYAMILARGPHCDRKAPGTGDYDDLPHGMRNGVLSVLGSSNGTPELAERVLDGSIIIGDLVEIGRRVIIGDGAVLGDRVVLCDRSLIEYGAKIGYRAVIGTESTIGDDAVIGDHADIGCCVTVGANARIGERVRIDGPSSIGEGVVIEEGETVEAGEVRG